MNLPLKRSLQVAIAVIAGVIIFLPKSGLLTREDSDSAVTDGNIPNKGLPVSAEIIKPSLLEQVIRASGTLVSSEQVNVTTEVPGLVKSIHFYEGTRVRHGDLLVRVNDDELQAQREKAIHQKRLVEEKVERHRVLLEKEAVSREAFDQVLTDLLVIESELRLLDTRINKTFIKAPFDGTVGFRFVSPGSYLQPGVVVTRLVKTSPLLVEFSIPEGYQSKPLVGRSINFSVAGYPGDFTALVYAVEPRIDERTRSLILRATYPNSNHDLLPGMFASIRLVISSEENALQIPSEAITPQVDGERVFLFKSGVAVSTLVTTGVRTVDRVAVTNGLAAGDTLITAGVLQLRAGMPVLINTLVE